MTHTKDQIIKMIDLDEPDYLSVIRNFDQSDVALLAELVKDANPAIAAKAVSCLGYMKTPAAVAGIEFAAVSDNPVLRVAAAHSLRNISDQPAAVQLVSRLLEDKEPGVRKFALKTVDACNLSSLKAKVEMVNKSEQHELLKDLSAKILKKL